MHCYRVIKPYDGHAAGDVVELTDAEALLLSRDAGVIEPSPCPCPQKPAQPAPSDQAAEATPAAEPDGAAAEPASRRPRR